MQHQLQALLYQGCESYAATLDLMPGSLQQTVIQAHRWSHPLNIRRKYA
jgi:hypothetical protein